jgi:Cu/Ag efflux protein CusF
MPVPTPTTDESYSVFSAFGAIVTAGSAMFGAFSSAGLLIWHRASKEAEMRGAIEQHTRDIARIDAEAKVERAKAETRHLDNLEMMGEMSRKLASQPDKTDLREMKNELKTEFNERIKELRGLLSGRNT